jgi:hypothetical protein
MLSGWPYKYHYKQAQRASTALDVSVSESESHTIHDPLDTQPVDNQHTKTGPTSRRFGTLEVIDAMGLPYKIPFQTSPTSINCLQRHSFRITHDSLDTQPVDTQRTKTGPTSRRFGELDTGFCCFTGYIQSCTTGYPKELQLP